MYSFDCYSESLDFSSFTFFIFKFPKILILFYIFFHYLIVLPVSTIYLQNLYKPINFPNNSLILRL